MKHREARSLHFTVLGTVIRLRHRLNQSAVLTWFIRAAIIWVVSLPLAFRAIQVLEHLDSVPPPAFVALVFVLAIAKLSLLVLLGRALDRVHGRSGALSTYKAASH